MGPELYDQDDEPLEVRPVLKALMWIVVAVVVLIGFVFILTGEALAADPAEDDPAFDCRIHGDRICGAGVVNDIVSRRDGGQRNVLFWDRTPGGRCVFLKVIYRGQTSLAKQWTGRYGATVTHMKGCARARRADISIPRRRGGLFYDHHGLPPGIWTATVVGWRNRTHPGGEFYRHKMGTWKFKACTPVQPCSQLTGGWQRDLRRIR